MTTAAAFFKLHPSEVRAPKPVVEAAAGAEGEPASSSKEGDAAAAGVNGRERYLCSTKTKQEKLHNSGCLAGRLGLVSLLRVLRFFAGPDDVLAGLAVTLSGAFKTRPLLVRLRREPLLLCSKSGR